MLYGALRSAFSDFSPEIRWQAADGNLVTTFKIYHGTHVGEFPGIAPTGRKIQFESVDAIEWSTARSSSTGAWETSTPSCGSSGDCPQQAVDLATPAAVTTPTRPTPPPRAPTHGIIDRFPALPMARSAVLAGRTTADAVRNLFVHALMGGVAYAIGFRFHAGPAAEPAALGLALAVGVTSARQECTAVLQQLLDGLTHTAARPASGRTRASRRVAPQPDRKN